MKLIHMVTVPMSLTFLRGHCSFLATQGVDVTVVTTPGEDLDNFSRAEGIRVCGIPMHRAVTPCADLVAVVRLVKLFRHLHPDVVHAHTPKAGLLGMISATLARVPLRVYHIHGLPYETAVGLKRLLLMATEWISCSLAHQVLCVSRSTLNDAVKASLCHATKGSVLGSGSIAGVDTVTRFNPRLAKAKAETLRRELSIGDKDAVVGYVGRIVHDKGIESLARAWELVRQRDMSTHLVLAGPTEEGDPVRPDLLQRLRRDPRVHFMGFVAEPAPVYSIMTVLALPSLREGFGLAALEASAMRVPVVASRVSGIVDAVVDGVTGTLVDGQDENKLARALLRYLDDPELCLTHGSAGRARAEEHFAPPAMHAALYHQYEEWWAALAQQSRPIG